MCTFNRAEAKNRDIIGRRTSAAGGKCNNKTYKLINSCRWNISSSRCGFTVRWALFFYCSVQYARDFSVELARKSFYFIRLFSYSYIRQWREIARRGNMFLWLYGFTRMRLGGRLICINWSALYWYLLLCLARKCISLHSQAPQSEISDLWVWEIAVFAVNRCCLSSCAKRFS